MDVAHAPNSGGERNEVHRERMREKMEPRGKLSLSQSRARVQDEVDDEGGREARERERESK